MARAESVIRNDERILVVKLADIGDAVLALPAIQALRSALSTSQIDLLTTNAGALVFERSPAVDEVIRLEKQRFDHIKGLISFGGVVELVRLTARLRKGQYRAMIVLHHLTTSFGARKFHALARATGAEIVAGIDNGRGHFLTHSTPDFGFGAMSEWEYALAVVEALGLDAPKNRPHISIPDAGVSSTRRLLGDTGLERPFIVMHTEVGEFSPARAWRDDYFAVVARELIQRTSLPVVTVGLDVARAGRRTITEVDGVVDLVGKTSFDELCALVSQAELIIGCDSSVAHLAAAFDRPLISLFGPSNREAWKPFGAVSVPTRMRAERSSRAIALSRELPCSPCLYSGFRLGRPQGCRSRSCLMDLQPDSVIHIAENLLRCGSFTPPGAGSDCS